MKLKLAFLAVLAATAVFMTMPASSLADPTDHPPHPCGDNSKPYHADDCPPVVVAPQIQVVVEPPGANCPAGGIKVTVTQNNMKHDEDDDHKVMINNPTPQVFFICNGVQGPVGPAGPAGPQGPPGPAGPAGINPLVSVEPAGANCANGGVKFVSPQGTFFACNGRDGTNATPRTCVSRRRFTIRLPRAYQGVQIVRAFVASRQRFLHVSPTRRVTINFRGIRAREGRGVAVAIRRRGFPSVLRVYTLCTNDGVGQINVPPRR